MFKFLNKNKRKIYIIFTIIFFGLMFILSLITKWNEKTLNLNWFEFFFSAPFVEPFFILKKCEFMPVYIILLIIFATMNYVNIILYYSFLKDFLLGSKECLKIYFDKSVEPYDRVQKEIEILKTRRISFRRFILNIFSFSYSLYFFRVFFSFIFTDEIKSFIPQENYNFLWFSLREKDSLYILPILAIIIVFVIPIVKIIVKKIQNKKIKKDIIYQIVFLPFKILTVISSFYSSLLVVYLGITLLIRIAFKLLKTIFNNVNFFKNEELTSEEETQNENNRTCSKEVSEG